MRILVMLAGLLFGGVAFGLNPHEMPESAHTVGKGNAQVHMGLGQSSYGLSDNVDLRSRLLASYFGFNAQLKSVPFHSCVQWTVCPHGVLTNGRI